MTTQTQIQLPTWKTVRIGNLGNWDEARNQLAKARIKISSPYVKIDLSINMLLEQAERTVEIVPASGTLLGLEAPFNLPDLYKVAEEHNLVPCPPDAALALMIQCKDELALEHETLTLPIAVKFFEDQNSYPVSIMLDINEDGHWVTFYTPNLNVELEPSLIWFFVRK